MQHVKLPSQAELRRLFDYQPETGLLIWRHRPELDARRNNRFAGKPAGYTNERGYLQVMVDGRLALAHRIIWKWLHDEDPPEVDHKDTNTRNNCENNLRSSDRSQNLANRKARPGKILPKGVYLTKHGRYCAQITKNSQTIHLGNFATPELASEAFAKAAAERHGEFARSE